MESKTHNLSYLLKGVMLGHSKREVQNLGKNVVTEDIAVSWAGRLFTIKLPLRIGPNFDEEQLFLLLSPNYTNIELYFHDSKYFILNENPFGPPTLVSKFDARVGNHYRKLALTEVNELDGPIDPCNRDQSYNFHACVKTSIAKQVEEKFFLRIMDVGILTCAGGMSH